MNAQVKPAHDESFAAKNALEQMHRVRREQRDRHEAETDNGQRSGEPGQDDHACDHRRRSQHDADLERGRRHLEVVVLGHGGIAIVLGLLGALRQLDGALARLWLGAIAGPGLLPSLDLLGGHVLDRLIRRRCRDDGERLGGRFHQRAPDRLVAAFEERLFLGVPVPVLVFQLVLGLVLHCVHAMAHVALLRFMLREDVVTRVPSQGLLARRPAAQRGRGSRGAAYSRALFETRSTHARELSAGTEPLPPRCRRRPSELVAALAQDLGEGVVRPRYDVLQAWNDQSHDFAGEIRHHLLGLGAERRAVEGDEIAQFLRGEMAGVYGGGILHEIEQEFDLNTLEFLAQVGNARRIDTGILGAQLLLDRRPRARRYLCHGWNERVFGHDFGQFLAGFEPCRQVAIVLGRSGRRGALRIGPEGAKQSGTAERDRACDECEGFHERAGKHWACSSVARLRWAIYACGGQPKLADGRCGRPRAGARRRPRYKSGWSTARRGPEAPGWRGDRRRAPAGGWQTNGAAHAAWRSWRVRARRATAPWSAARCAGSAARPWRRRTGGRARADRRDRSRRSRRPAAAPAAAPAPCDACCPCR